MGSSLTLTLANIFMSEWEKKLVEEQTKTGEFYGRYIDDIFMTWNRSEEELRKLLDDVNTWHPNIKLDYKIGYSLPFLDVQLTNNNGILSTCVYHKPAAEPYVTPFTSDHPRHVFSNIIKTSIERAIRYSSTFEAFNYERRYIKLMLLHNEYPSTFIENEFHKYFSEYISKSRFLPLIDDEQKYFLMRKETLGLPTPRQSQVAMSAALADIDNDPPDDDERQQPNQHPEKSEEKIPNYNEKFFTHFTYEKRFETSKRDMHQVYNHAFKDTPAMYTKQIVGNRIRRPAHNELIRKRPNKTLLQNTTTTKSVSSLSDNGGKIAGIIVGSVVGGLIIFSCCCILYVLGVWSLILYLKGGPVLSNKLYIRSAFGVYSGTGNIIFQPGTFSSYYFKNGSWHGPHDLVLGFYPEANYIVHGRGRDEMGAFAIT
ncbi:unnamed protein product [Rotaria socialis]|uniref:Helix-turn-helix domain-containing protein n=1 Tax=Rotaria socialis TaxID=392032 RepID=A0A818LZI7_9BILA|nr:unnamed protein product [Rotaria socialis]CAF4876419.1 unnamed protein product [Rotaria socialis]